MAEKSRELIKRWSAPESAELAVEAVFRLIGGESFADWPMGEVNGMADLRGLPFPMPVGGQKIKAGRFVALLADGVVTIRDRSWQDVDLSFADLRHLRFFGVQVSNCVFDGADLRGTRLWKSRVTDSSFVHSDMRDTALGTRMDGVPSVWSRVDFSGADFRGLWISGGAQFTDCSFENARLDKTHFLQCEFERVKFAGTIREALFDGRNGSDGSRPGPMRHVDFSDATLVEVDFRGCRFEACQFPDRQDVWLVNNYPQAFRRQQELLKADGSREARWVFELQEDLMKWPWAEDSTGVILAADWARWFGRTPAELAEAKLRQALSERW